MNALIEVDAAQFLSAPQAVHHAITIARVTADLTGTEADTLAALMLALIEGGSPAFTITIDGDSEPLPSFSRAMLAAFPALALGELL